MVLHHSVQLSAAIIFTNTDISPFVLPVSRTTGSLFQITRATLPRKVEGEVEVKEVVEVMEVVEVLEVVEVGGRGGTRPTSRGPELGRAG